MRKIPFYNLHFIIPAEVFFSFVCLFFFKFSTLLSYLANGAQKIYNMYIFHLYYEFINTRTWSITRFVFLSKGGVHFFLWGTIISDSGMDSSCETLRIWANSVVVLTQCFSNVFAFATDPCEQHNPVARKRRLGP